jgi:hypothetical protein
VTKSFKQEYQISADASGFGVETSASFSYSRDQTNSSEVDTSKSTGYTIQVTGPSRDGIDHDQD